MDEYREQLQTLKNDIFGIFLENNNNWLTIRQIHDHVLHKHGKQFQTVENAIDDSLHNENAKDEYKIVCNSDNKINVSNQFKYRLKTENINNKEQLEDYLKDKKCIINVNRKWFESCYPEMKQDLAQLESDGKIILNKKGIDYRQYIYVDTLFTNYQEKKVFKNDTRIKEILVDAKKQNQITVNSQNDKKNNVIARPEQARRTVSIQNYWIEELQQELQKR